MHLRLRLSVAAGRDSQADLCAIAGERRFTAWWQRSRWTRRRTWRAGLLGQDEVEESVQQPAQHRREQAALWRYPGQCIDLTERSLLPIDIRAERELD